MRCLLKKPSSACLIALTLLMLPAITRADPAPPPASGGLRPQSERFSDLQKAEEPSFRRHVIPMMARAGCSGRECHGSFQGRGGFQLSLFGSEWDHDHVQITQTKGGADLIRVDRDEPEKSLILLKPTAQVEHKGKERIKRGSWEYNLLLKWLQSGAKNDADRTGELAKLEVTPSELLFSRPGETTQLHAVAHWKDGVVEDVTQITRFKTNDETVASVSDTGLVTCTGKGDSHVVASYDSAVQPVPVLLPVSDRAGPNFPPVVTRKRVDELVVEKLRKVGVVPSEVCTDAEFLRRLSLDLAGTLPTPDAIKAFLADPSPGKRGAKVEELLQTPAYAGWWTTRLCDYTGNSPRGVNAGGTVNRQPGEFSRQWYQWLYKRVADNTPYDQIVAGVVLATSRSSPEQSYKDYTLETDSYFRSEQPADFAEHPTLPYFWQRKTTGTPQEKALAFTHAFMGVRLECAQCHKHPFDRWTKRDFEQFTAFFAPVVSGPRSPPQGGKGNKESKTQGNQDKGGQAAPVGAAAPEEMTYQSLTQEITREIKEKVTHELEGQESDPKKLQQLMQKAQNAEISRRIDAGEPVPWPELWVNGGNQPRPSNKKSPPGAGAAATPKILGGEEIALGQYPDPRQPLMHWLRDKANPYFAKAFVNRVWANYFGRGIVDPPDDLNLANAPSNAPLLDYLAGGFIEHGFDMRWLHREICNSDAYQRSWKTNQTNRLDARNFSHAAVRQLPAEVMLDAIDMATGPAGRLASYAAAVNDRAIGPGGTFGPGKGKGQKGPQGGDGYALSLFGRPLREVNCDCERGADPTLLQTLYTLNDPSLLGKIDGGAGWVAELRKESQKETRPADADDPIMQAFLRTVSRPPTQQELEQAKADVAAAKTPADGVRDLLWALINTREFKVNH